MDFKYNPFTDNLCLTESSRVDTLEASIATAYGHMYAKNTSITITVAASNTAYEIASGISTGLLYDMSFDDSYHLTVYRAGWYHIVYNISAQTGTANDEIETGVMLNGAEATSDGGAHSNVGAANKSENMSGSCFVACEADDQLSLYVRNHTAAHNIIVEHLNMTATYFPALSSDITIAGVASATQQGTDTSIDISMPYTGDANGNNTYAVEYKLSSSDTWLDWGTNPKAHSASPYTDTITGLTADETYDVRLTYGDADGVFGTAEQLFIVILSSLPSGAVAYWKFDETGGSTAYDSVGSNDGTLQADAVFVSGGKSGYAVSLDGTGDYVEMPNDANLNLTDELTIEMWFKPAVTYDATLTNYVVLLDRQWTAGIDSYFLGISDNGTLLLGSKGGSIQSTQTSWTAGTWYHVVGTYRDVSGVYSGELYVNGVAETLSVDNYDNMTGGGQKIGIGGSDRLTNFNGIIDEVVIYNRTLTAEEVLARYNSF